MRPFSLQIGRILFRFRFLFRRIMDFTVHILWVARYREWSGKYGSFTGQATKTLDMPRLRGVLCPFRHRISVERGDFAWLDLPGWICLGTVILVCLPALLERWLDIRLQRGFFLFCVLYAMGPMLGKAFKLYYLTPWWDKLLHTSAGFLFAALGAWAAVSLNRGRETSWGLQILFGVFLSISVSALWELVEFGIDRCFGADMQNDTVVYAIHSYLLGAAPGEIFSVSGIRETLVNGVSLGVEGYLDIGLIDTMGDVLVETLGALGFGAWSWWDRGRHPLIQ